MTKSFFEKNGNATGFKKNRPRVLPTTVPEIGWWGPDDYTNPHTR